MRILEIRFRNLNSLAGEWRIDLTHPAFVSDGIFAITGPTGAGKTTILDAVCLALYGRTPRLSRVNKNGNDIMSRRTGDCFAETVFETPSGRYRCHWSQRRARRKADGELQAPRHEMADADSGEILETGLRDVAERMERVTGMDFDRFTRSMMLAQGGFAVFLQAPPSERSPILERITGTDVYTRISCRVHERLREEREALRQLQAETAGIAVLEPEQEAGIAAALAEREKEEAAVAAELAGMGKAASWLAGIGELRKELGALDEEAARLQRDMEAFGADRERLDRASRAAALDGAHAALAAVRRQQAEDAAALDVMAKTLRELEISGKEHAERLTAAQGATVRARDARTAAAPLALKARALDQRLADLERGAAEGAAACERDAARIAADKEARRALGKRREETGAALDSARVYLEEHARDEWLVGGLTGVEAQLGDLLVREEDVRRSEAARETAATAAVAAARDLAARRKLTRLGRRELAAASRRLGEEREALRRLLGDRLLREYRAEKESLLRELAFLARIAELEEHRARLEDGRPCPLCGATAHPYAKGNIPVPDETERRIAALTDLIGRAERQESAVKELEAAEARERERLAEAERLESAAAGEKMAASRSLAEASAGLKRLRADFAARREAVAARLAPLGVASLPDRELSSLLASLRQRRQAWQENVRRKAEIEKRLADLDSEARRMDAVAEAQAAALAEKRERLGLLRKELAATGEERRALYGDRNPDEEERRLEQAVAAAEEGERLARERHGALQREWIAAKTDMTTLERRVGQRAPELQGLEAAFVAALASANLASEADYVAAALPAERRAALAAAAAALDERRTDLKARREDRERRLAAETARRLTEASPEELGSLITAREARLGALREEIAALRHSLRENAAARDRARDRQAAIDLRRQECRRWERLHDLIGSSEGTKYRNFVQGLTFEIVTGHANRQLRKLTDRYLLVPDATQPLELNVIDAYQAGEVRSTKNLSGGESFLVSLSLALGLSHMAGRNVRVDSLFLDEGFGTLDEDALDTALEALASLRQDGKLIGVISHVPALRERIGTQIRVTPQTGGRSRISGPGCGRGTSDEQEGRSHVRESEDEHS